MYAAGCACSHDFLKGGNPRPSSQILKEKTTSVVDELVGKRLTELAASLTTVQKLDSPIAASPRICNKIYKTACFKEIVKEMDPRISEAALPKPLRPEHV